MTLRAVPSIILSALAALLGGSTLAAAEWAADLAPAANMGFTDAVAGDGTGGWSDQGPANSFADFPLAQPAFGGVPFTIPDPAAHNGAAVLTFRHAHFPQGLDGASVAWPAGAHGRYLYLLHSACWAGPETAGTAIGTVQVDHDAAQVVTIGREVADWWNPAPLANGAVVVTRPNGSARVGVYLSRFDRGADRPAAALTFHGSGTGLWIVVGATLTDIDLPLPLLVEPPPPPAAQPQPLVIRADATWKPLAGERLAVQPGSALDCSAWLEQVPAGAHGRVFARPDGHLAFTAAPATPVRFLGCAFDWLPGAELADPAGYAEAVRRQGYNLVRFHFLDAFLAGARPYGQVISAAEQADYDRAAATGPTLAPAALAALDRLVAELKQRGIYLYLDAMTSWTGYYPVNPWTPDGGVVDLRLRMYADPLARTHYRATVTQLLTHRNPFTGTTLAEDPQVAVILGHNETAINLWKDSGWSTVLLPAWRAWLARTYATPAAWRAAWGGGEPPEGFAAAAMFTLADSETAGVRGLDVATFLAGVEAETSDFMAGVIRAAGYRGIYTNYDHYKSVRYYLARARLDAVAMHAYHCHPTHFISPGSRVAQVSSLADGLGWWRTFMASRIAGLPQLFSEYGHVYWNRYRYEEGLAVGAYAALQDVDLLMAHANPVRLAGRPITPFAVGCDPIARASQVVTGLAWRNRAVAPSPRRVDLRITRAAALAGGNAAVSGEQSRLALLTGFATSVEGGPAAPLAGLTIPLRGGSTVVGTANESRVVEAAGDGGFPAAVDALRRRGVLPATDATDAARGRYASDTGELLLAADQLRLTVATPTLAGIALDPQRLAPGEEPAAGRLHVLHADTPAALTVAALDGLPLEVARRLLLVVATDARNSGEEYADAEGSELRKPGGAPVLLRCGRFRLLLERTAGQPELSAWTLALDGTRRDALAVTAVPGGIALDLDSAAWAGGPTPFIELAAP